MIHALTAIGFGEKNVSFEELLYDFTLDLYIYKDWCRTKAFSLLSIMPHRSSLLHLSDLLILCHMEKCTYYNQLAINVTKKAPKLFEEVFAHFLSSSICSLLCIIFKRFHHTIYYILDIHLTSEAF